MTTDPGSEQTVRDFLRHLEAADTEAALALLDDDVEWRNTGLPTVRGRRVRGMLRDLERRGVGFAVTVHHAAASDGIVLTERTDVLRYGRWESSVWVCGTFEVRDGRIVLWDDHFSWGNLLGSSVTGLVRALARR
jgi:limonene-1,2-epoxide hydrolase